MQRTSLRTVAVALAILLIGGMQTASAGIVYLGGAATENFNTLPNVPEHGTPAWADDVTLPGWFSTRTLIRIDDGTQNNGDLYSYGTAAALERALGSVASNATTTIRFGLELINGTGQTLNEFTLAFTGEQWRRGDNSISQRLDFAYSANATSLTTGTYVDANQLDFVSLKDGDPATALNGNAADNRTALLASITGFTWAPGASLWLRWTDLNDAQSDNGLAIDDLSFSASAVPEPGTMTLLAAGGLFGLVIRRTTRQSCLAPTKLC